MAKLKSFDPISGKEGVAYAKINGNNEELFFAKTIEASVEKAKSEIKAIGRRMTGHKTTGMSGSGKMTLYYLTPAVPADAQAVQGHRCGHLLRSGGGEQ